MAITIEEVTPAQLEEQAKKYLLNTDWMINKDREEADYTVPTNVLEKRAYARTLIDTTAHKAMVADEIDPIFYNEPDHLLAFKNLVVNINSKKVDEAE